MEDHDEGTDPAYRPPPPPVDERPTQLSTPTLALGDSVALGHLAHIGETLTDIRDHVRRLSVAVTAGVGVVRWVLDTAGRYARWVALALLAVALLTGTGLGVFVGVWLLLR